jgi:hypothetical protein
LSQDISDYDKFIVTLSEEGLPLNEETRLAKTALTDYII